MNLGHDFQSTKHGILTSAGLSNAVLLPKPDDNPVGHGKLTTRCVFVAITMQSATVIRGPIGFNLYERLVSGKLVIRPPL